MEEKSLFVWFLLVVKSKLSESLKSCVCVRAICACVCVAVLYLPLEIITVTKLESVESKAC